MSKPAEQTPQQEDIDIQHDDEFEDFRFTSRPVAEEKKRVETIDDWDDDVVDNFSQILKAQRAVVH
ncbi:hypothetical protein TVAG_439180 [Trichomonas vaginalis G3]|uniref:Uncharacterized protein n=1 Tax=Trichomonas vaginalis (strain ATCC PRA-98 / G3) TaxID=412133 RepID=A2FQY5_TRIV3|nr:DSS1 SEM1 2 family [Trichomonas vaginalis G3]EAX92690.1 hypothetical protein TVAG_439180 [Trichomonas vaginalis G3]KAI5553003.1 DSS1 SEM1 2 family [Trichomonas vaginalis G3]|eukprot:XP_001305620.1 hypothetical protein [Trichomonas vaginalis G3]